MTGYPFYNASAFTMATLKNEIDPQRLKMNMLEYFNGFSPDVQDVIDKFQLRHWVDALTSKGRLGSILEKFTDASINLSIKPVKDEDGTVILPAFGTPWKEDLKNWGVGDKKEVCDPRVPHGETSFIPDIGDCQMLFLANSVSRMKDTELGTRIVEVHSSQNGEMASCVSGNAQQLNEDGESEDTEDKILRIIKGRKLAKNANYYAFTATPKNKTLEMFGDPSSPCVSAVAGGLVYVPFHEYTMKQAIEEKFILDVIRNYTPYQSFYEVVKKVADDPLFDKEKAPKRIRAFVERQPETIEAKSRIIVEHFCTKVFRKIGGKARAMVVTSSIERAIDFYKHISRILEEQGGKFKAIVAFTDKEIDGHVVTESSLNGFPSAAIEDKIDKQGVLRCRNGEAPKNAVIWLRVAVNETVSVNGQPAAPDSHGAVAVHFGDMIVVK